MGRCLESRVTRLFKEALIFPDGHELNFKPASTPRRGGVFAIFFWTFRRPRSRKRAGAVGLRPPFGPPPFFSSSGDEKSKKRLRKLRPASGLKGGPGRRAAGAGAATGQDPGGITECHCGERGGPGGAVCLNIGPTVHGAQTYQKYGIPPACALRARGAI